MNLSPQGQKAALNPELLLKRVLRNWYWVMGCVLLALAVAAFFNHYALPKYQVTTTLQVNKANATLDPLELLFDQRIKKGQAASLQDEAALLMSIPLVTATVQAMNLEVSYYLDNPLDLVELYKQSPIQVRFAPEADIPYGQLWRFSAENEQFCTITTPQGTYERLPYGEPVAVENSVLTLTRTRDSAFAEDEILFSPNRTADLVTEYQNRVVVGQMFDQSSILRISLQGQHLNKERDFLNMLTAKIIEQDLNFKKQKSDRTVAFIEDQLQENTDSLRLAEGSLQRFKNEIVPVNPGTEGGQLYANIQVLRQEKANIALSNQYFDYLTENLNKPEGEIMAPSAMGVADPILNSLIARLVDLQLDVRLMSDSKGKNPLVQENIRAIEGIKNNILATVRNQRAANDIRERDLNQRIGRYNATLQRMPQAERDLVNIQRNYRLNEELYLLLMQKKLEAGINIAAIASDYMVVNAAFLERNLTPGPVRNYLLALLLGLLLPLGAIVGIALFNDQINSKDELRASSPQPVIVSILHETAGKKNNHYEVQDSLRIMRLNLRYLPGPAQVLLFTSSVSNEGKTFCSRRLAEMLAQAGHKTLLIEGDLRRKTARYEEGAHGLSGYLSGQISFAQAVEETQVPHLSVIPTGTPSLYPAELLDGPALPELLRLAREQFEYVLVDTPPAGIFSDALSLVPLVDHIFVIVRQGYTRHTHLQAADEKLRTAQVTRYSIVWNDSEDKLIRKGYNQYYAVRAKKRSVTA